MDTFSQLFGFELITYVVVSVLVVSNKDSVPDVINSDTAEDHVRVVKFVVVAHP